jgi:hypothetical protein
VEAFMPHRRIVKKGSFAGHLDELVKVLEKSDPKTGKAKRTPKLRPESASVHDHLFERAWKASGPKRPL